MSVPPPPFRTRQRRFTALNRVVFRNAVNWARFEVDGLALITSVYIAFMLVVIVVLLASVAA